MCVWCVGVHRKINIVCAQDPARSAQDPALLLGSTLYLVNGGPPQLLSFAWVSLEELRSLKQENARRPPVERWRQCAEARPDGATLSDDELQWAELWDGLHAALREIHAAHAPPGAASDAAASAARLGLPDKSARNALATVRGSVRRAHGLLFSVLTLLLSPCLSSVRHR